VLYDARCAKCGKDTKVVFAPKAGRPIYCKTCLKKIKSETMRANEPENSATENRAEMQKTISIGAAMKMQSVPFKPQKRLKKEVDLSELREVLKEAVPDIKKEIPARTNASEPEIKNESSVQRKKTEESIGKSEGSLKPGESVKF